MSRTAREYFETSFFHVMVQGINKEYIFKSERYIKRYIQLIKKNLKEENILIVAFCIMNNHAHLLVRINDIKSLSKYMQKLNSSYAKYYNYMENERVGYVFRDRYKSQPILDKNQLIRCIKYIHNNPVKAKMVKEAKDYNFSSFKFYDNLQKQIKIDEESNLFMKEELVSICNSYEDDEEEFLDIDNNIEKKMNYAISKFIIEENIKIFEIFEKSDILKKLIKYLKKDNKIKYVDIMKKFDITKGTLERLKK